MLDQVRGLALPHAHAAPELWHDHADVVVNSVFWPNVARGAGESAVASQDERTSALFMSTTGHSALNGPLVSAPSLPKPVVDGDLPVRLLKNR